jgi:hypothetical protein
MSEQHRRHLDRTAWASALNGELEAHICKQACHCDMYAISYATKQISTTADGQRAYAPSPIINNAPTKVNTRGHELARKPA